MSPFSGSITGIGGPSSPASARRRPITYSPAHFSFGQLIDDLLQFGLVEANVPLEEAFCDLEEIVDYQRGAAISLDADVALLAFQLLDPASHHEGEQEPLQPGHPILGRLLSGCEPFGLLGADVGNRYWRDDYPFGSG